ncbi:MAG: hypothetical protein K2X47_04280, partial [Bdellovibrionales bacterium]|nr:hypothetical protein [Bdellovibrionales bacterium]
MSHFLPRLALFIFIAAIGISLCELLVAEDQRGIPQPPSHDAKTLSRMIQMHASLDNRSAVAKAILDSISRSSGKSSPEATFLRSEFLKEIQAQKQRLEEKLKHEGYSENDVRDIAGGYRSLEDVQRIRKIDSTQRLSPKQIQSLADARTISELEEALTPVVHACDGWRQYRQKSALKNISGCPEPLRSCARNPSSLQAALELSAAAAGVAAPQLNKKIRSLLAEKSNMENLRTSWSGFVRSAVTHTLSGSLGRAAMFQILEEQKILPGNVVSQTINAAPDLIAIINKEEGLQAVQKEINHAGELLRRVAKDADSPALFDIIVNVGEHFAWCETEYNNKEESRIPFLMRKEILYAVMDFQKELSECQAYARAPASGITDTARAFELKSLVDLGSKRLMAKDSGQLALIWKSLSPDSRAKLVKVLESNARYEGQLAIAAKFDTAYEMELARYMKATEKIENFYLTEDQFE